MLGDILSELDKGFRRDKEKICKLIFALHNLPRVYLSMEEPTLCLIGQRGIDLDDALNYSKMSMDDEMIVYYKNYFAWLRDNKLSYMKRGEDSWLFWNVMLPNGKYAFT